MNTLKYIVTAILIHTSAMTCAQQTTWEFVHRTLEMDEESIDLAEHFDGSVFVIGRTIAVGQNSSYKSLVFKLDKYGNFVDSIVFTLPGRISQGSTLIKKNDEQYILLTLFRDLEPPHLNGGLQLNTMNSNLSLIDYAEYLADSNYSIYGSAAYRASNGDIFLNLGVTIGVAIFHTYLIETDSNFNIIKERLIDQFPAAYSHLKKIDNNTYWGLNLLHNKYQIFDSAFNLVEEQKVPERITSNFGVKWDSDTSFYLMGDHMPGNYHNLGFLRQPHYFDTTGYLFNSWGEADTLDFPAFTNGIDFRNKDSIFIGGTHNMPYALDPGQQPVPTWFVILQTDSLLNVRWERFYGGNANYLMMKLIATRDGGCLVAGTRYDYMNDPVPQTDIIVLKLNSEGLLVGDHELPETRMHEAIVYPNPGTHVLQIRLAVQHPTALLELFDANGRLVLSQQLYQKECRIAVDHLPNGTYIYRLSADTGLLESGKWIKM